MRYIIGIDLGTTNCCTAYVDTQKENPAIMLFRIPQSTSKGFVESQATLPSFCYLRDSDYIVGSHAREQGAFTPTRLVQSAKSWLCHPAANRRDKILPLEAVGEEIKISPVEATARYLKYIKESWNGIIAKGDPESEFDNQEIVLTVPASFDEVARALTVEGAKLAGYKTMTLLEEPQAAFYSWIAQHENTWENLLFPGASILVCDVGGGTTDFSLIDVVSKDGKPAFQRMSVGNRLLLGGDNMDATITHRLEAKLLEKGHIEFSNTQWLKLKHEARKAKESLLNSEQESFSILLQGSGSAVIQGTLSTEISKKELQNLLLEGFFGIYPFDEAVRLRKTAGLRTMGLPYEDDPSITKHLANFLNNAGDVVQKPDFVLFNGGAMKPQLFQDAIIDSLKKWFPEKNPQILSSYDLDLAVARGAAYYGMVRRGLGVKIGGGSPRSYYLIVEHQINTKQKALTLLPRGFEEGNVYEPEKPFLLYANKPVSFQLCTSNIRLHDKKGELIDIDPHEIHLLPPIHTILRYGKRQEEEKIPVNLLIGATAIGTLEMNVKSQKTDHLWALEFQLRGITGQENSLATIEKGRKDQTFDAAHLQQINILIEELFKNGKLDKIMENLEETICMPRKDWPPSILRGICDTVLKLASKRKISSAHELRWWNLIGFNLRPGFGYPLDDFRIKEIWKVILSDLKNVSSGELQIQMWICYRRIAGGLSKGQQSQIAGELMNSLLKKTKGKIDQYQFSEKARALSSLELIETNIKIKLGNLLLDRIKSKEATSADLWCLGRIGARHLMYGTLVNVVPKEICGQWIERLLEATHLSEDALAFLIGQLARKTTHREINLTEEIVNKVLNRFGGRVKELLTQETVLLTQKEQEQVFGEQLPPGILIL